MPRTIIQSIGPLYGETVNGTVFGRPNGSIFVPSTNTIVLSFPTGATYIRKRAGSPNDIDSCDSLGSSVGKRGTATAQAQDLASYIVSQVSDDEDFATYVSRSYPAGQFNLTLLGLASSAADFTITDGATYYVRAVLMASTGVPVSVSEVFEMTGYAPEE